MDGFVASALAAATVPPLGRPPVSIRDQSTHRALFEAARNLEVTT